MTNEEIIKKIEYGLEIASELPDLEFKTSTKIFQTIFGGVFQLLLIVAVAD